MLRILNGIQCAIDVFTNKLQQFALYQIVNEVKELKDRNCFLTFDDMIQKLLVGSQKLEMGSNISARLRANIFEFK